MSESFLVKASIGACANQSEFYYFLASSFSGIWLRFFSLVRLFCSFSNSLVSSIFNSFLIVSPQRGHLDLLIDLQQPFFHRIIRISISLLLLCYSTSLAFILDFYMAFLLLYR